MSARSFILVVLLVAGEAYFCFAEESPVRAPLAPALDFQSAGSFFDTIDKQCQPNWSQIVHPPAAPVSPAREALSFEIGVLVSDAFAAIQAHNGQSVKNTAHEITALTKKLNLDQGILARNRSISDFADKGAWNELQIEINAAQKDIISGMQRQNDRDLMVFLLAGSWVRQIDIAATLATANPKPELAVLLAQPAAADELLAGFGILSEPARKGKLTLMLVQGILAAKDIMLKTSGGALPDSAIKELASTMAQILNQMSAPVPRP